MFPKLAVPGYCTVSLALDAFFKTPAWTQGCRTRQGHNGPWADANGNIEFTTMARPLQLTIPIWQPITECTWPATSSW